MWQTGQQIKCNNVYITKYIYQICITQGGNHILKQSSIRMKKLLAVLLAVLFVTSLTAVAVSARGGHGGGGWGRGCGGYGMGCGGWGLGWGWPYMGYGYGLPYMGYGYGYPDMCYVYQQPMQFQQPKSNNQLSKKLSNKYCYTMNYN